MNTTYPQIHDLYFVNLMLEFTKSHHRRSYRGATFCLNFGFEQANQRFSMTILTDFRCLSREMKTTYPHFHDLYFTNLKFKFTKTHHKRSYRGATFGENFGFRPNLKVTQLLNERLLDKNKGTTVTYSTSSTRISNKIIG